MRLCPALDRAPGEGVAINRIVEIGDRLRVIAFALIDEAPRMEGLGAFRIEPDRKIEIGARGVEIALNPLEIGAAEIGRRMIWVGRDGGVEWSMAGFGAVDLAIGERAICQRRGVGRYFDCLVEIGDHLGDLPIFA